MRLLVRYLLIVAAAVGAAAGTEEDGKVAQTFTLPAGMPEYASQFSGQYKGAASVTPDQTFTLPPGVSAGYSTGSTGYKGTASDISEDKIDQKAFVLPPGVPDDYNTISTGYKGTAAAAEEPSQVGRNPEGSSTPPVETQPSTNSSGVSITLSLPSAQEPRQADSSCSDILTTTFFDENEEERDCAWLADELARDYNRANLVYCGMMGARALVGYRTPLAAVVCPVTCGLPCTYEESTCKDSSALVEPASVLKKNKKCGWVKKNVQRIEKYCSAEEGVRTRGDAACPKTCGKCGQLSASAMTEVPSSSPSTVPTMSAEPSSTPTMAPVTSTPSAKPSVTASSEPSVTPSAEPSVTASNEPSVTASSVPSFMPTTSPSAAPTLSHSPTAQPTATPTKPPTTRPTYDLEQRSDDRNAQCGKAKIDTYDFDSFPTIDAVCDVCVSSSECAEAGDGTVRCCKWTWGQVCMRVAGIWTEAQVEQRCL